MSFLDPFGLLNPRPGGGSGSGSATGSGDRLRDWVEATSHWADPRWWLTQAPGARTAQRSLLSLAAALAERFTGRTVEVRAGGRTLRGVLDAVRVDAGSLMALPLTGGDTAPVELRVQAHDVHVDDDIVLDRVHVVAGDVTLHPGVTARVSAEPIEIEVRVSEGQAVRWLRRWLPAQWGLDAMGPGRVLATRAEHELELEVEPHVHGGTVEVELRALRWRGVRVKVPNWLRLAQRHPLPALPAGMELVDAWQADGSINVRLRVPYHEQELRLDRLRDAVARDDTTLEFDAEPEPPAEAPS